MSMRGSRKPSTVGAASAASYQDLGAMNKGTQRSRTNNMKQTGVRSAVMYLVRKSQMRIRKGVSVNAASKANAMNGAASNANSTPPGVNDIKINEHVSTPLTPNAITAAQRHQTIAIDCQGKFTTGLTGLFMSFGA
jgi:hypothetical protein